MSKGTSELVTMAKYAVVIVGTAFTAIDLHKLHQPMLGDLMLVVGIVVGIHFIAMQGKQALADLRMLL